MREPRTTSIAGCNYTVTQLAPLQALDLLTDLFKLIGPGLGPILENGSTIAQLLDSDLESLKTDFLAKAIDGLTKSADKALIRSIIAQLSGVSSVPSGKLPTVFDAHFAQHGLGAMFQWVAFAIKAQFDDFFGELRNVANSAAHPQ